MNINLARLTNDELVTHVNECISQYEAMGELNKTTNNAIYSDLSLRDFQQFDKHLQRCLVYGTSGASEAATRVKEILKNDVITCDRQPQQAGSLYDYYKKTGQVSRFFDVGGR